MICLYVGPSVSRPFDRFCEKETFTTVKEFHLILYNNSSVSRVSSDSSDATDIIDCSDSGKNCDGKNFVTNKNY